jgi:hypothetical protein
MFKCEKKLAQVKTKCITNKKQCLSWNLMFFSREKLPPLPSFAHHFVALAAARFRLAFVEEFSASLQPGTSHHLIVVLKNMYHVYSWNNKYHLRRHDAVLSGSVRPSVVSETVSSTSRLFALMFACLKNNQNCQSKCLYECSFGLFYF